MCEKQPLLLKLLVCISLYANPAGAQFLSGDPLNKSLEQSYPVRLYYNTIGENAHIYNGYEYMTPDRNIKGSPYFTDAVVPSTVSYDDTYYLNVRILYDMVRDLVIINRLDQNFRISLINSKLNSFSIKDHQFIRIDKDSVNGINLITGFYDRIYPGKSTVLVKRKKFVKEVIEYTVNSMSYMEEDLYYVKFAGNYVQVKSKSAVFKLFQNKKTEIKSYLRKNKLSFKSDFEKTLIATCAYYDQLTS